MSSNWKTYKLSNLCDIGSSKRIFQHEYVNNGIPFLRSKEVIDKALGSFEPKDLLFISHEKFNEIKSKYNIPKAGELLLSSVGNRSGIPYVIKEADGDFYFKDGNLTWFKNFKSLDSNFLFYWINSSVGQNTLNGIMIGSAQKALTISGLQNLTLTIPPLPIQKKIAHVLSTLDDKIELNRKMNQTLEEMASAIFKSWFVDFDPVHAKANCTDETELENIAKELGISKDILDLFPSEFEESELGMIPKGWEDTELSHICKIQSGYAFKSDWWQDTGVKVIKIKNIDGNRVNTLDCECVSEEIATKNSNFKLSSGDMLIAMTGATVGKVGVIYTADEEYLLNQRVGRFQPIAYYDEYVKIFANSSKFFQSIQGQAQGSAQPNISAREIESVKIIKPNDEIMKTFSLLLNPFFSKILEHQGEIQTLEKTRDTLLPKLLSGEIDVSDLSLEME